MPERKLPVVYVHFDKEGRLVRSRTSPTRSVHTRLTIIEYIPRAQANEVVPRVFSAWLRDRAEQYSNDTCCRCVFDELMKALDDGEPWEALKHGELDDILKRKARGE